jgi:hypothetical protein
MVKHIAARTRPSKKNPPGARLGRVRWTICAMLFRRHIHQLHGSPGDLHPQADAHEAHCRARHRHDRGGYGTSVRLHDRLCLGLLARAASSIRSERASATWSSWPSGASRPWATRWPTRCSSSASPASPRPWRVRQLPCSHQDCRRMVSAKRAFVRHGHLQLRRQCWRHPCALIVPWVTIHYGWHAAFLATGVFSAMWIVLWFSKYRKPADHPTSPAPNLRHIYREAAEQMGPSTPWLKLLKHPPDMGISIPKFLTDPIWWFYLFWLPSSSAKISSRPLSHLGLPLIIVYNASASAASAAAGFPAPFRRLDYRQPMRVSQPCFVRCAGSARIPDQLSPARSGSPSLCSAWLPQPTKAGQPISSPRVRHVSPHRCRLGDRHRRHGRLRRRRLLVTFTGYILQLTHSYASLFAMAASAYLVALLIIVTSRARDSRKWSPLA